MGMRDSLGTCSACGKQMFPTRAVAKRIAKRYPGAKLSAYQCGDAWHLGRLPPEVSRGVSDRDALRAYPPSHTRRDRS